MATYGPDPSHDLRDALRERVDRSPELRSAISAEWPGGPLAVTHRRRGTDRRYDAIYVSPELDVLGLDHLWEEAVAAGSDHAAIVATLD